MRIHTDTLNSHDLWDFVRADERLSRVWIYGGSEIFGSRSHDRAYDIRLTGSNRCAPQGMPGKKAATYAEWGWFLAAIFNAEPTAKCGPYKNQDDFNEKTQNEFSRLIHTV